MNDPALLERHRGLMIGIELVDGFGSSFKQGFDQRLRGEALIQMFGLQRELRLAGGIELLVGSFAGRTPRAAGLHLGGRRQGPDQDAFGAVDLRFSGGFDLGRGAIGGGMLQFLAQHGGIDSQFLRNLERQFVAHDAARYTLNVGQKMVHRFDLAIRIPRWKQGARPVDQIIKIFLRVLERRAVCVLAFAPDEQIGIESSLQGEDPECRTPPRPASRACAPWPAPPRYRDRN